MINRALEKFGIIPLTTIITLICIVASVFISLTIWSLLDQQELFAWLTASIFCPLLIAPFVTYILLKLLAELEKKKEELSKLNKELENVSFRLEKALSEVKEISSFLPACDSCKEAKSEAVKRHLMGAKYILPSD